MRDYDWLATPDAQTAAMYAEALDRRNASNGRSDGAWFESDAADLDPAASSRARAAGQALFESDCPERS